MGTYLIKLFYGGKPELLGAIGDVCENPSCWEWSEEKVFEKQSVTLAAARTIIPCNHTT